MKDWIEKNFKALWIDVETDIDFTKEEPSSTSSSLHIFEEQYKINGSTYRLLYPISDDKTEPVIQVLKNG
jgi:hypothetical protein